MMEAKASVGHAGLSLMARAKYNFGVLFFWGDFPPTHHDHQNFSPFLLLQDDMHFLAT
jgi:hypothetical protein